MYRRALILVVFLAALVVYMTVVRTRAVSPGPNTDLSVIPLTVAGYLGHDELLDERVLALLGADDVLYRSYRRFEGRPLWVFLGYFGTQQENSQIHSPKHCYPGSGWSISDETTRPVSFDGVEIQARSLALTDGRADKLVVYWFHTESGVITNEYVLKFDQMKSALLRRSQRATFLRFSTLVADGEDSAIAERELTEFINLIGPYIVEALGVKENS